MSAVRQPAHLRCNCCCYEAEKICCRGAETKSEFLSLTCMNHKHHVNTLMMILSISHPHKAKCKRLKSEFEIAARSSGCVNGFKVSSLALQTRFCPYHRMLFSRLGLFSASRYVRASLIVFASVCCTTHELLTDTCMIVAIFRTHERKERDTTRKL